MLLAKPEVAMAWFTTGLSGNPADSNRVFARHQHTVYCVSCADWVGSLVHSLHTTGRHQCLRNFTIHSASSITGVRVDGHAISGSREQHEFC